MTDVQKFTRAIDITNLVYRQGSCLWQEYLKNGNVNVFTSKNGARDLMKDVNYEALKETVFKKIFENLINYYRVPTNSTTSSNLAANYIALNTNFYRNQGISLETYDMICEELLKPQYGFETLRLIKNIISTVPNSLTIEDLNFNTACFLNELLYTKERTRKNEPTVNRLLQRIEELELENKELKEQLLVYENNLEESPKR